MILSKNKLNWPLKALKPGHVTWLFVINLRVPCTSQEQSSSIIPFKIFHHSPPFWFQLIFSSLRMTWSKLPSQQCLENHCSVRMITFPESLRGKRKVDTWFFKVYTSQENSNMSALKLQPNATFPRSGQLTLFNPLHPNFYTFLLILTRGIR